MRETAVHTHTHTHTQTRARARTQSPPAAAAVRTVGRRQPGVQPWRSQGLRIPGCVVRATAFSLRRGVQPAPRDMRLWCVLCHQSCGHVVVCVWRQSHVRGSGTRARARVAVRPRGARSRDAGTAARATAFSLRRGVQPVPRDMHLWCVLCHQSLRACGGLHLAAVSRARPALSSYTMATSRAQPLQGVIGTVMRNVTVNLIRIFVQIKLL